MSIKRTAFLILLTTILLVDLLRFFDLENVPQGFYIDEIASAVSAHCLATQGTDIPGKKWPLFSFLNFGSPKPPTQTYPMALWIKIFGVSIASIRGFEAFAYTLGLVGLFFLARLMGGPTCAWLTLLASSLSPWGWMFSRIAFESILGPMFLVWGVFFFLRNSSWWNMAVSAFFMACAMYSYPPTRLHAPLVVLLLVGYQMKQKKLSLMPLGLFFIVLTLCSAPLVEGILQGPLQARFNGLSIASKTSSWRDLSVIFTQNYFSHLSPKFLFLTGDNNYRHSTRHFGELSWLDMLGLCAGLFFLIRLFKKWKAPSPLVIFLLMAAASGIIPAALTNEGLPHALRSMGTQPFIELLVGYCLAQAVECWPPLLLAASVTGAAFGASFLFVYFKIYPGESAEAFMSKVRIDAEHCQTERDWSNFALQNPPLIARYYILRNYHKPCSVWFLK